MSFALQKSDPLRPENDGITDPFHKFLQFLRLMLAGCGSRTANLHESAR